MAMFRSILRERWNILNDMIMFRMMTDDGIVYLKIVSIATRIKYDLCAPIYALSITHYSQLDVGSHRIPMMTEK